MPDPTGWTTLANAVNELRLAVNRVYDVKTYGATGDGTTDDAAAIAAAIDAMPATGGQLFFPSGTYALGAIVDVTKPIEFVADYGTEIIRTAVSYMFRAKASHVSFRGFKFSATTGQGGGVLARDVAVANALHNTNWSFEDCEFQNAWLYFERLGATIHTGDPIETGSDIASNIHVKRCYFHDMTGAPFAVYLGGPANATISDCTFINLINEAVDMGNAIKVCSGAVNWRVSNNYIKNTQRSFMDFFDARRGTVIGNHCDTSIAGQGIMVKVGVTTDGDPVEVIQIIGNYVANTAASGISAECDNVIISGNMVEGCSTGIRAFLKTGTPSTRTINQIVANNWVRTCGYGLLIRADYAIVTGNQVHASTTDGIFVEADYVNVSNNCVTGSGSYDIRIMATVTTPIVSNNFTEDGTPAYANPRDITIGAGNALYFGQEDTDGTWKIVLSGNDLLMQRRESGSYVTKSVVEAAPASP